MNVHFSRRLSPTKTPARGELGRLLVNSLENGRRLIDRLRGSPMMLKEMDSVGRQQMEQATQEKLHPRLP